jgi:hypothetical protein
LEIMEGLLEHEQSASPGATVRRVRPTAAQRAYLERGLNQPGGKLPLFDKAGQLYNDRTIRSCIDQGWAAPWFTNPIKPDWLVCKLTDEGRALFQAAGAKASRE